jgi:hypothetical protein
MKLITSLNEPRPTVWQPLALSILFAVLCALAVVVAITMTGCSSDWNRPTPIHAEPGLPCGRIYHQCPITGGCCGEDEVCRPGGYCAYVGGHGPLWGASTDGGAERLRPQLSPADAQKAGPR